MKQNAIFLILCLVISGCAIPNRFSRQLDEIEKAHANGQLTTAEYLSLKQGVESQRMMGFIAVTNQQRK